MSRASDPLPEPDDTSPDRVPAANTGSTPAVETCPLCGTAVAMSDMRCPSCNRSLAGVGNRPGPFSRRDVVLWAVTILVIYLAVMAAVFAAR